MFLRHLNRISSNNGRWIHTPVSTSFRSSRPSHNRIPSSCTSTPSSSTWCQSNAWRASSTSKPSATTAQAGSKANVTATIANCCSRCRMILRALALVLTCSKQQDTPHHRVPVTTSQAITCRALGSRRRNVHWKTWIPQMESRPIHQTKKVHKTKEEYLCCRPKIAKL